MGDPPKDSSIVLTREKGLDPKNPRWADKGEGCADSTQGTWPSMGLSVAASLPHKMAASGPPRRTTASIAH